MSDNTNNTQQNTNETSKVTIDLNVIPGQPGNSTSQPSKPTEPSGGDGSDANTQAAVQKHVELRKQAEETAANEKKRANELQMENIRLKKEQYSSAILNRIKSSKLPESYRKRIEADPVKWLSAHANGMPENATWDDFGKVVTEQLDGIVSGLEVDLGFEKPNDSNDQSNKKSSFTDSNRTPNGGQSSNDGKITLDQVKKMSPYELANLPDEVKQQLMHSGDVMEI